MQQFFMTRRGALALLLDARRRWGKDMEGQRVYEAGSALDSIDAINRLILDVRAYRTHEFSLAFPLAADVVISSRG